MKIKLQIRCLLTFGVLLVLCRSVGGGLMHMMMMKKMMEKHHHDSDEGKSIGITFKPISIPIPIPVAYVEKGSMKAEKSWTSESKGMMWKMMKMKMKMKMKMMKKMKKMMKGSKKMCCAPQMQMKAAWPMMMPVCPQEMMMMMMMKGGCGMPKKGCVMNGGWPMKGGCPPEEPEEEEEEMPPEVEDWPDYYEEEMMEDQYAWDTRPMPVYSLPENEKKWDEKKRGDDLDDPEKQMKDSVVWGRVKNNDSNNQKLQRTRNSFDYDYDFDYI
ncbi:uncharacterized protein CDAR_95711 [Caerostris darwini]|uniref:Uncharacterized protein n=1 Tax=Caerostris darwini TaxID=1538125 RepID=A0AAV4UQ30_9ARAC|nr:uncharacterized protein CDAR_95711 [Caerostris darwini]